MDVLGIGLIEWIVIAVYLLGITALGVWASRRVHSSASFFMGDRKYGPILMAFFMFGTGTHSDQAVSVAAKTYRSGASGIWYQWLWLFATPFFWLIAPMFRRMRAVTTGDYFDIRYGPSVAALFALVGMLQLMFNIGLMLKGSSAMITAVSGGTIDPNIAIIAMTIMFVIYGVAGGLNAAIVTDLIQGIMTVILSFMILPIALHQVGGMSGLRERIAEPGMLEIVASEEITVFYISVIAFNALVGWVTQPHTMANCAAGRTEIEGRVGVVSGLFLKRICTIPWMLTGLAAVALYAGKQIEDVDHVYGLMAHDLLPLIGPGLIGLFLASMLAAVMSSCDAFMVVASALFTENVYRRFFKKEAKDSHYVLVGRISAALIVLCGILFAFNLESVITGLEIIWKVAAMMGIPFWAGLFWRRATVAGAWTGTLVSFATLLFTSRLTFGDAVLWDFNTAFAGQLPHFMIWNDALYLPWQMIMYMTTGLIALVAVSLMTRRVPEERLERFYNCLRTPITTEEPEAPPFTLPQDVTPRPRRSLIAHPDFEIPIPRFIDTAGFVISSVFVGILIAFVYWLLS